MASEAPRRARRVAVLTTSRADYGLLYWLLREFRSRHGVRLQLLVCGSHLSISFGRTIAEIRRDGFRPAASVATLPHQDTPYGVACAVGAAVERFAGKFRKLSPDLLVVLGDRYELLAACSAAVALRIPIAHIHGGESTEGVIDDQIRHAVTKMSHLHFTAAEPYRRRVISMGEQPSRVFNFGAPGLEYLRRLQPLSLTELARLGGDVVRRPFALLTYHPASCARGADAEVLVSTVRALRGRGLGVLATFANADAGGGSINASLRAQVGKDPDGVAAVASLGQRGYLTAMKRASLVIGNSSSGIIEAPSAGVPTVNIGDRQKGRLRSPSIIDCSEGPAAIGRAIDLALSSRFRRQRCRGINVYGGGHVASRIVDTLLDFLPKDLLRKSFYDAVS